MPIIFKEGRELAGGGQVEAGKVYTYSPEDEQAFVDNEVADYAPEETGKKKTATSAGEGENNG